MKRKFKLLKYIVFPSIPCISMLCFIVYLMKYPTVPVKEEYKSHHKFNQKDFFGIEYGSSIPDNKVKQMIRKINHLGYVVNEDIYGPLKNDSVVIVIQVHNRYDHLKQLILSLFQSPSISDALLVFSHDYIDKDINMLVHSIDFCKWIQLFYPYSMQLYPNSFPGGEPGKLSIRAFTSIRHHWWWKANQVFNILNETRNHQGLVMFLEDDHYVAEDFLYVLNLMKNSAGALCPSCNVFTLGNYRSTFEYFTFNNKVEKLDWTTKQNMGFAFNRSTWNDIQNCAKVFCSVNMYNWDWALLHISKHCLKNKLITMTPRGTRVFHMGKCGFHAYDNDCNITTLVDTVKKVLLLALQSGQLYPSSLRLINPLLNDIPQDRNPWYGYWSDPRDHQLCLNMTVPRRYKGAN